MPNDFADLVFFETGHNSAVFAVLRSFFDNQTNGSIVWVVLPDLMVVSLILEQDGKFLYAHADPDETSRRATFDDRLTLPRAFQIFDPAEGPFELPKYSSQWSSLARMLVAARRINTVLWCYVAKGGKPRYRKFLLTLPEDVQLMMHWYEGDNMVGPEGTMCFSLTHICGRRGGCFGG